MSTTLLLLPASIQQVRERALRIAQRVGVQIDADGNLCGAVHAKSQECKIWREDLSQTSSDPKAFIQCVVLDIGHGRFIKAMFVSRNPEGYYLTSLLLRDQISTGIAAVNQLATYEFSSQEVEKVREALFPTELTL